MVELTLDIDNFNKPRTLSGSKANAAQIEESLLGKRDSHVTDGVMFMISRYRFKEFTQAMADIKRDLESYCSKYLPNIYIQSIDVKTKTNTSLYVYIYLTDIVESETSVIVFSVEQQKNELLVNLINS